MPDFEMPYIADSNGNKGIFKDVTAPPQIAGKVKKLPTQNISYACALPNNEYIGGFCNLSSGLCIY